MRPLFSAYGFSPSQHCILLNSTSPPSRYLPTPCHLLWYVTHFIIIQKKKKKPPEEATLLGCVSWQQSVTLNIASLLHPRSLSVPGWLRDVFARLSDFRGHRSLTFLEDSQPERTSLLSVAVPRWEICNSHLKRLCTLSVVSVSIVKHLSGKTFFFWSDN